MVLAFCFCPVMSKVVIIVLLAQLPTVILLSPFGSRLILCKQLEKKIYWHHSKRAYISHI